MATISDIRSKYPGAYDDLDDQQLADALYSKFYSDMDRREFDAKSGLTPYQGPVEVLGATLSNVPGRMQMGLAGVQRMGPDMANAEINQFFDRLGDDFTLSERPGVQEVNFMSWAKQRMGIEPGAQLTPEQRNMIQAMGRDPASVAEYEGAITDGAMIGPGARQAAEGAIAAELRMMGLQSEQAPIDAAPGSIEGYVAGAVGAVAEMAPALAASVVTKNPIPAMVWAGMQSGGIAYDEARQAGLDPETAQQYAGLYALAEGIPEALPVGIVLARLKMGSGLGRAMGEAALAEGIQEGVTEGIQALIDQKFIDPDMTWGEAWEQIKDASITGAIAGPAMVGVAQGTQAAQAGVGRAAQGAVEVSQAVLGNVQNTTRDIFDATWDAVELTAARVRGLPLNEQVEAFARDQHIQPEGSEANTLQVDESAQPISPDPEVGVLPTDGPTVELADLTYTNEAASRNLPVTPNLETAMKQSVAQVFGPGYRIEVMSGGQGEGSRGQVGSRRHDHGNAGDVWIIGPDGQRLQGDDLLPFAEHWISQGYGSVGFPSNGSNSLHLDLIHGEVQAQSGEGRFWFYGDATPEQRAALERAASGAPARGLSTIDRIIMAESSGDPNARNRASSAGGLGQFIDSTWLAVARRHGGDRVAGLTDAQILELKMDTSPEGVAFHRQMLEAHTQDNATALQNAGVEANDANLYAAHFLGVGRAAEVLGSPDGTLVSDIVPANVISANPFLSGMTVADFKAWAAAKMDQGALPAAGRPRGASSPRATQSPSQRAPQAEESAPQETMRVPEGTAPLAQPGIEYEITTPTGQRIQASAEVVDIGQLQRAEGQLQPRDRGRAASTAQIEDIAINLDPARLVPSFEADRGAPIVGPDGVVESGNGRVEALRRVYEAYPEKAEAYRQMLRDQGYDVPDGSMPVLVSRRTSDLNEQQRREFVEGANTSAIARMSSAETAANDARLIGPDVLGTVEPGTRMTPAAIASPANPFTRALLDRIPQAERSSLVDRDGRLNADGVRRVQNALLAAAFEDVSLVERFSEAVDDNTKAITGALADIAADWAALKADFESGALDPVYDMTEHLAGALSVLSRARELAAQQGRPVRALISEALNQTDMLGGGVTPEAAAFVRAFYTKDFARAKSRDHVYAFLRNVVAEVRSAAQPQMLGEAADPGSVIDGAGRRTEREQDRGQGNLLEARSAGEGATQGGQRNRQQAVQPASAPPARGDQGSSQEVGSAHLAKIVDDAQKDGVIVDISEPRNGAATISRIVVPEGERGSGVGSRIMQDLASWADANGVQLRLTPSIDFGGSSVKRLTGFYKRFGFVENKGSNRDFSTQESMYRDPVAAEAGEPQTLERLDREIGQVEYAPGPKHVPTFAEAGMPTRPANDRVRVTGGEITIPKKDVKRDLPRKKLLAVVGDRIYFQRIKGKRRLGYYRPANSEIRIKKYDDVEVMAHEAAHFLDFDAKFKGAFTAFRRGHASELNDLSYTTDPKLINIEGFAEFVRLWATNYAQAQALAPQATVNFETALRRAGILSKMKAFQAASHRWLYQGTMGQFLGKSGESKGFFDGFNAFLRSRPMARYYQGFIDPSYAAKVIEREATGTVADAPNSSWKLSRMTVGGASMAEAVIIDGTPMLMPDGSYGFRGKSLADIFKPVTSKKDGSARFDALMAYFKARRARELMAQGRENLFTREEIEAGLSLGKQYPEFESVFKEYQQFNSEMLDFYTEMGLLTPDQRAAFAENNVDYVPFHRVLDKVGGGDGGAASSIDQRLTGGEQNTREIIDNIIDGLSANIHAALVARARAKLFTDIQNSQAGSEFAVRIDAGSKPLKVALEQYKSKFSEILLSLGYEVELGGVVSVPDGGSVNPGKPVKIDDVETLLKDHPELLQFWQHNQRPSSSENVIEPVNINGKTEWFEVRSPLLVDFLTAPRSMPTIIRVLGAPKRFVTTAITSMVQFLFPNFVRDTVNAGVLTQSKFMPFVDSGKGMRSFVMQTKAFREFRLNGGLFSGRIEEGVGASKEDRRRWQTGVPAANAFAGVARVMSRVTRVASPFEQATRVGQFERATQAGVNPLEAAFQGREISTDFAQVGRNEVWRWLLATIPFANAALQGNDLMLRNSLEVDGKIRPDLKSASRLGVQYFTKAGIAVTTTTIALWLLNGDDDRYKALTVDEKARFWHVWLPTGQHIQIPKPYGVGFIFADIPEIALDYVRDRDGDAVAKQVAFGLMQHFWFFDYPAIVTPFIEALANKKFTGAPIVPASLAEVEAQYQYTERTPEIYRALGKTLGVSPLLAEHYIKSFTGYLEAAMVDATEWFLWDTEAWGEKPFSRGPIDYFSWQFNGREVPYRTKWTEGYYDLRRRALEKARTYSHTLNMSVKGFGDFEEFTENEVNLMLRELNGLFNQIDKAMSDANASLVAVKYNPDLSRAEKERQIDEWYAMRNEQLATAYDQANAIVQRMERDQE